MSSPNRSSRVLIAIALTAMVGGAGCYAPAKRTLAHETEWRSAQVNRVEIRGRQGRIGVEAVEGDTIRLEARVRSSGRNRDGDPNDAFEAKLVGDTLRIREKASRRTISFPFHTGRTRRVDFELHVPRHVAVSAETINGHVDIDGIAGPLELSSVNGRIQVATPSSHLKASTVNGSIRAQFSEHFPGARLRSVNGSIAVEVPQDASLDLDIRQVNGSFRTDLPVLMETTGRSGTRGSLHGGKFPLQIETVNGSVRLVQSERAIDATRG